MPRRLLAALAATALLALAGCESLPAPDHQRAEKHRRHDSHTQHTQHTQPGQHGQPPTTGTALVALAALPVKGRAPMTGYDRSQFGTEWDDSVGDFTWTRNGCDTRNDVLARDLRHKSVESNGCVVTSGVLAYEPYTGQTDRVFVAGGTYEQSFDVEHIVALGNAWATGAQQLSATERAELANDPINLYLADPSLNRSKGDADFATWLPPNKDFRCSYAARQIRVKAKYGLWVAAPEKAALERVLSACPNEPLDQPEVQAGHKAQADGREVASAQSASSSTTPGGVSGSHAAARPGNGGYANCDAVRAAGAAPIHQGDPGFASHLDGDGDGVACE